MDQKQALRASAGLAAAFWLGLSGCGMGSSGCGSQAPATPPNCNTGYYAPQNSDGSYGACQPISSTPAAPASSSTGKTTPAGP